MQVRDSGIKGTIIVIVGYKPKAGKNKMLLKILKEHVPILRKEGLATDYPSQLLRAKDGTYIEIFEWLSSKAIEEAHSNKVVLEMWKDFDEACEYVPLMSIEECKQLFAGFEPINV
jgi:hypothetical protein